MDQASYKRKSNAFGSSANLSFYSSLAFLLGDVTSLAKMFFSKPADEISFIGRLALSAEILVIYFILLQILVLSIIYVRSSAEQISSVSNLVGKTFVFVLCIIITQIVCYADVYRRFGLADSSIEGSDKTPMDAGTYLYFSVVTWTTVGYGDVVPKQGAARFFAASEAISGQIVNYFAFAAIVAVFSFKPPRYNAFES